VGKKLPNGYHELDTLFIPLPKPYDILEIFWEHAGQGKKDGLRESAATLKVEFSIPEIDPQQNTLTKAYAWYSSKTGFSPSLRIRVKKNIPHGAGLGGGSSDAAALLLYLQKESAKAGYRPLEPAELREKSTIIGADVPFFLLGVAAKAGGTGEKLTAVPNPYSGYVLLLVCPQVKISTAWAFGALDESRNAALTERQDNLGRVADKKKEAEKNLADRLTLTDHQDTYVFARESPAGNDFEQLVFARLPLLARLYAQLSGTSAEVVRMSGTGSSIFALFRSGRDAQEIAGALAGDGCKVYTQVL
jgi:4-diphosphocytidyl-2-C-methyl-D-erythritol kinase